jgi:D-alanyl-D-alanine carboxypeptidase
VSELQAVDSDSPRIMTSGGYGSRGELVRFERDAGGSAQRVVWGGTSQYPVDVFRARQT